MRTTRVDSSAMMRRVLTAGAIWAVAKVLDAPRVARVESKVNRSLNRAARKAGRSLSRRAKTARKNKGLLAAGVAALTIAAGLFGRAVSR